MYRWLVTAELWPYHGFSQESCGPRTVTQEVTADDMKKAVKLALLWVDGVKVNPRVWQVPIMSIVRVRP